MSRPLPIHDVLVPVPDEEPMSPMPGMASPTEEDDAQGRRKMDQELRIMAAILRNLDELDQKARPRVVAWLYAREAEPCK